ncbi:MAG: DNA polymerase Y family protein [Cypionkella sp.]|nr:DNA polymerase Y family protein [Cypionkella sp.]
MSTRRILSLWFPRMAAERAQRLRRMAIARPLAIVGQRHQAQVIVSLNIEAEAEGLTLGQSLRDATALCADLQTLPEDAQGDRAFLAALGRWAGKFSPWIAEDPPDALIVDLTGAAHLFGGEDGVLAQVAQDCADLGLSLRAAVADTRGAAWALARYAGACALANRSGNDIRQEARATRSRAAPRNRTRLPASGTAAPPSGVIAAPGTMRQALAPLPIAALRLPPATIEALGALGLTRIRDIAGLPRAALARRFGPEVLLRLDQAFGTLPEPVNPAADALHLAVRITFPDPIGLFDDVMAGIDRLLPALCARLRATGRGLRLLRVEAQRSDGRRLWADIPLARPTDNPESLRPLIAMKVEGFEAGFGFDRLRLEALDSEALPQVQHGGPLPPATKGSAALTTEPANQTRLEDLLSRLSTRLGQDVVLRLHPAESHVPEKTFSILAAAWAAPATGAWPAPRAPRPMVLFRPEPVRAPEDRTPPAAFRWRGRDLTLRMAVGPERILPEWWLDDPDWRIGPRDYWRVEVTGGDRLWLFYAHGAEISGGWFCHGSFG